MSLMLGIMDTHPPTTLHHLCRGVDVGAPLEEQAHDLDMHIDFSINQDRDSYWRVKQDPATQTQIFRRRTVAIQRLTASLVSTSVPESSKRVISVVLPSLDASRVDDVDASLPAADAASWALYREYFGK